MAALALAGAPPAGAATLHKGFWGPTTVNGISQFPIYHDLGVDIYQTSVRWDQVAPTRPADARNPADPAYLWPADVDFAIQQASSLGMRVLIQIIGAPPWSNGGRSWQYAPSTGAEFAAFARAAARRYPAVHLWMVWGEPGRAANFLPLVAQRKLGQALTPAQAAAPERYARLLDASYGALKAGGRRNLVIGGDTNSGGEIRPRRWVQNMRLPNGRPPRLDLYGHNPFALRAPDLAKPPSPDESVDFSDLGRFQKVIDQYLGRPRHKRIRFFISEYTVPTDTRDSEFNYFVTRPVQARWIRDAFKVSREIDAYGLGWVHLYDDPPAPDGAPVVHGGLLTYDGQKKPGYFAFKRG